MAAPVVFSIRNQDCNCRNMEGFMCELVYWLARCTNPELVAKCEHILCMTSCELNEQAAKPKFVAQS